MRILVSVHNGTRLPRKINNQLEAKELSNNEKQRVRRLHAVPSCIHTRVKRANVTRITMADENNITWLAPPVMQRSGKRIRTRSKATVRHVQIQSRFKFRYR